MLTVWQRNVLSVLTSQMMD